MAGVGFELKKLFKARTATGKLKAYSASLVITTGPFILLAGLMLAIQGPVCPPRVPKVESDLFIGTTVYAFVFSQILSSGFVTVQTRYLADCLSEKRYGDITASLFGINALFWAQGRGLLFYLPGSRLGGQGAGIPVFQ